MVKENTNLGFNHAIIKNKNKIQQHQIPRKATNIAHNPVQMLPKKNMLREYNPTKTPNKDWIA